MYKFALKPIITEKSTLDSQKGKYHFAIPKEINKIEVAKQLEEMYGKPVQSVRIINQVSKVRVVGRGRVITKRKAKKKAIVTFQGKSIIDINKIK